MNGHGHRESLIMLTELQFNLSLRTNLPIVDVYIE